MFLGVSLEFLPEDLLFFLGWAELGSFKALFGVV